MANKSSFLSPADLTIFTGDRVFDPAYELGRAYIKDQLAWLHEQIYPEIRRLRWDLHWNSTYSISPIQTSLRALRIDAVALNYSKAEMVIRLMQKRFGENIQWEGLCALEVRVDAGGLHLQVRIGESGVLDGQNFQNRVRFGAPEKRALRQILAELGGDFVLTLRKGQSDILRTRCSRLLNLGVLDATLEKFHAGDTALIVGVRVRARGPAARYRNSCRTHIGPICANVSALLVCRMVAAQQLFGRFAGWADERFYFVNNMPWF